MTTTTPVTTLADIATEQHTFAIVAMDQRNTLKRMFHAQGIADPSDQELVQIKADTVEALRGTASAFLLDPTFGMPAVRSLPQQGPGYGVLLAAEPAERGTINGEPRTHLDPALNAQWVIESGATALKFFVQLRADRPVVAGEPNTVAEISEIVRSVVADCRRVGVPSVIENLIFPLAGEAPLSPDQRTDAIIEAALLINDLEPDLLKIEYPGSPAACRRLADALDVPWAVLSAGVDFDQFADVLRICCDEGGVSGFIAGRSIWKDTVGLSQPERKTYLASEGKRRLDNLVQVIDGRAIPFDRV